MTTLLDSGVNLKEIQVKEFASVISDINENFTKILNLPGFRGIPGNDGSSIKGDTGERGNNWIFANGNAIMSEYSIPSIQQITLSVLTTQLNADANRLHNVLNVGTLIDYDIVVLPTGIVGQLRTSLVDSGGTALDPVFQDTGISFAGNASITEDRVNQLITNAVNGISLTGNSPMDKFGADAKNTPDTSPGNNGVTSNDSAIDVRRDGIRGAELTDFAFYGPNEASKVLNPCYIIGNVNDYHEIMQNSLTANGAYWVPGVDDFISTAILQNSNNNGLIIGQTKRNDVGRPTSTFRDFARMYRTDDAFRITSSYVSDREAYSSGNFAEVLMSDTTMTFNALTALNLNSRTFAHNGSIFSAPYIYADTTANAMYLGARSNGLSKPTILAISANDVRLPDTPNASFLSTNTQGSISATYSFSNARSTSTTAVISGQAIFSAIDALTVSTESRLNALQEAVNALAAAEDVNVYTEKSVLTSSQINLTNLTEQGSYLVPAQKTVSGAPPNYSNDKNILVMNFGNQQGDGTSTGGYFVNAQYAVLFDTNNTVANSKLHFRTRMRIGSRVIWQPWREIITSNYYITASNGIKLTGTDVTQTGSVYLGYLHKNFRIEHGDTGAGTIQSVNNSGGNVIQDITVDQYGHITNINSTNLDDRYFRRAANLSDGDADAILGFNGLNTDARYDSVSSYYGESGQSVKVSVVTSSKTIDINCNNRRAVNQTVVTPIVSRSGDTFAIILHNATPTKSISFFLNVFAQGDPDSFLNINYYLNAGGPIGSDDRIIPRTDATGNTINGYKLVNGTYQIVMNKIDNDIDRNWIIYVSDRLGS